MKDKTIPKPPTTVEPTEIYLYERIVTVVRVDLERNKKTTA